MFAWKKQRIVNSLTKMLSEHKSTTTVRDVLCSNDLSVCVRNEVVELVDYFAPLNDKERNEANERLRELSEIAMTMEPRRSYLDYRLSRNATNILSNVGATMLKRFLAADSSPFKAMIIGFLDSKHCERDELCNHYQRITEAAIRVTGGEFLRNELNGMEFARKVMKKIRCGALRDLLVHICSDFMEYLCDEPTIVFSEMLDVAAQNMAKFKGRRKTTSNTHTDSRTRPPETDTVRTKHRSTNGSSKSHKISWRKTRSDYEASVMGAVMFLKIFTEENVNSFELLRTPEIVSKLVDIGRMCPERSPLIGLIWRLIYNIVHADETIPNDISSYISSNVPTDCVWTDKLTRTRASHNRHIGERKIQQFAIWGRETAKTMYPCLFHDPPLSDYFGLRFIEVFKQMNTEERLELLQADDGALLKYIVSHVVKPAEAEADPEAETRERVPLNGHLVELALIIADVDENNAVTEYMKGEEWMNFVVDTLVLHQRARRNELYGFVKPRF